MIKMIMMRVPIMRAVLAFACTPTSRPVALGRAPSFLRPSSSILSYFMSSTTPAAGLSTTTAPKLGKLDPATTFFFLCDIQERFRPLIHEFPSVISTAKVLVEFANTLESPVIVTEQYPKALGNTVPELQPLITERSNVTVYAKTQFSMLTPEIEARIAPITSAVLFGTEAHVCVLNTAIDLLRRGIPVYVVVDAISSQRAFDRTVAIERLRQVGALFTTVESIMFEIIQGKDHPKFKETSALAKRCGEVPSALSHL